MDWKAFFNPKLVFFYPVRTLAMLSTAVGVVQAPFDFNNRYLAFGFFLLSLSFAANTSRHIYPLSSISHFGEKTPRFFSFVALLQSLFLWPLTIVFALLCLHQLGLTPRLDAYLWFGFVLIPYCEGLQPEGLKPLDTN